MISNGSSSAYYNSKGSLVFSEEHNNSVSTVNNETLVFPVTSSILENPNYVKYVVVFTSFNATMNSSMSVFYLDSLYIDFILNMFPGFYPSIPVYGLSVFSSLTISTIVFIRKRKTK